MSIFTKVLRPVVKYLRTIGWKGLIYIDDLITIENGFLENLYYRFQARDVVGRAGWMFNESKGQDPAQDSIFLGFVVDTVNWVFKIPEKKMEDILAPLFELLKVTSCPVRALTRLVGKICACYRALGPISRLMTRSCFRVIASSASWSSWVKLSDMAKKELRW